MEQFMTMTGHSELLEYATEIMNYNCTLYDVLDIWISTYKILYLP